MKIVYVKSLEERCKKIIVNQKIEKPKLLEGFEEKYALCEYHNKIISGPCYQYLKVNTRKNSVIQIDVTLWINQSVDQEPI